MFDEWRTWIDPEFVDAEGPRIRAILESALASERAKRLAAETVIEKVSAVVSRSHPYTTTELGNVVVELDAILATADLSALREHDAKVKADALEEAKDTVIARISDEFEWVPSQVARAYRACVAEYREEAEQ
jgi:hypothetical protein